MAYNILTLIIISSLIINDIAIAVCLLYMFISDAHKWFEALGCMSWFPVRSLCLSVVMATNIIIIVRGDEGYMQASMHDSYIASQGT